MTNLGDLPGFGKPNAQAQFREEDSGGFDDFNFDEDHLGDSSNKFDDAEKHLREFEKEENEGYQISHPGAN